MTDLQRRALDEPVETIKAWVESIANATEPNQLMTLAEFTKMTEGKSDEKQD